MVTYQLEVAGPGALPSAAQDKGPIGQLGLECGRDLVLSWACTHVSLELPLLAKPVAHTGQPRVPGPQCTEEVTVDEGQRVPLVTSRCDFVLSLGLSVGCVQRKAYISKQFLDCLQVLIRF